MDDDDDIVNPKKKPIIANGIAKMVCENRIKLK